MGEKESRKEEKKEGKEEGWMSELIELHLIFENRRCKPLGNFNFLVSEN